MENSDFYPPKPELVEHNPKSSLSLTVFSMVLFVLIYLMFFGKEEFGFIVYLLVVLVIHELGHFFTMKTFKYENVRMLFIPLMGAFVQGKKRNYSKKQSLLVIVAGPFPGIFIGSVLMWYSCIHHIPSMLQLSALFLLLNVINLLPIDPLDGGQLLKIFFRKHHELLLMVFAFLASISVIVSGFFIEHLGYLVIMFGFFMGFRVRALQKKYQMHKELRENNIDYSTTYKHLSNREYSIIKDVVISHTPQLQKYIDHISEDQAEPLLAGQVNSVLIAPLNDDASFLFRLVILVLWLVSFVVPIVLFASLDTDWIYPVFDWI
ncbi:hypothetical protein OAU25_01465 [Crocinitomicaceae bacterium]|nr:hypothetical protein [Crocinitomicaceae bacterium]